MTALFVNNTEDGRLHHFILGFEPFQNKNENTSDEKTRLNRYYEQLKQSIVAVSYTHLDVYKRQHWNRLRIKI